MKGHTLRKAAEIIVIMYKEIRDLTKKCVYEEKQQIGILQVCV